MAAVRDTARGPRAGLAGAVRATVDFPRRGDAVPDYAAAAMGAVGGQHLDRAFEAVEVMACIAQDHFETMLVFISTRCTARHRELPSGRESQR